MHGNTGWYELGGVVTGSQGEWKQPHSEELCCSRAPSQAAGRTFITVYLTRVSLIHNQPAELLPSSWRWITPVRALFQTYLHHQHSCTETITPCALECGEKRIFQVIKNTQFRQLILYIPGAGPAGFTNEKLQVPSTSANLHILNLKEKQLVILCDCGILTGFFSLLLSARNKCTKMPRDGKVKGQGNSAVINFWVHCSAENLV